MDKELRLIVDLVQHQIDNGFDHVTVAVQVWEVLSNAGLVDNKELKKWQSVDVESNMADASIAIQWTDQ